MNSLLNLKLLHDLYLERDIVNPAVIVDANHSNSNKKYKEKNGVISNISYKSTYLDLLTSLWIYVARRLHSPKFGLWPMNRIGHFFYANVYIRKFFKFYKFFFALV